MKYQVFDNDKPADSNSYPKLKSGGWDNSIFDSLDEAQNYANSWLGHFDGCDDIFLEVGEKLDYSGYGDYIEIRAIEV